MSRTIATVLGTVLALAVLAALTGFLVVRRALETPFQAFAGDEVVVTIPSGTSVREGLELLEARGVLRDARLARLYWKVRLDDPVLKAGEYRFRGPAPTGEVLEKLVRGEVLTHAVTVLEGLTVQETAEHLAAEGFGDLEAFVSEMSSPARVADLDPEAVDLEGYLFPDTYAFSKGTSEADIVSTLVGTFRSRLKEAMAAQPDETVEPADGERAARRLREIVILASIVEKEALQDEERPIIAGVYSNRLSRGIGLYADPTIIFALKRSGTWDGNLRRRDLELESPYNTYRNVGLPPGPICSPGLASLRAAARPADVPYLYFVSRNDGTHVFATTLAEHNRNVFRWQKLYWRERWAKERASGAGADSPGS